MFEEGDVTKAKRPRQGTNGGVEHKDGQESTAIRSSINCTRHLPFLRFSSGVTLLHEQVNVCFPA